MINFIIYEDQKYWQDFYKEKINKKMNSKITPYTILIYKRK